MATTFDYSKIPVESGMTRNVDIPSSITDQNLMAADSIAANCFINQKFSRKLQAYLIGYVNSIYSDYSVFK